MGLYLSEQLIYTLGKLILQLRYIFLSALFSQSEDNFIKCSHKRKDKFPDSENFHFDESSKSSGHMLLAFRLLLFFHMTSFTK